MDHARVGNVRPHGGRDPEQGPGDGEDEENPPTAVEASKETHAAPHFCLPFRCLLVFMSRPC
jgi:hypothetical protein